MIALLVLWVAAAAFLAAVMAVAWRVQRRTGQGGWADVFWSFGLGAAGVGLALWPLPEGGAPTVRQLLVAGLIGTWGLRLGWHIAARAASGEDDPRYARLREQWGADADARMFLFLMIQALAAAGLAVSVLLAARNPAVGALPGGLAVTDLIAAAVLAVAVLGEGRADQQLAAFRKDPANKGRVCDAGLWSWTRHPNYFFEWLGWCAWPLFASSGGWPWALPALIGPVAMYLLLTRASGVPPLEQHMAESRPGPWRAYVARVPSAFWPRPPA